VARDRRRHTNEVNILLNFFKEPLA
jgi:hypothetical protein